MKLLWHRGPWRIYGFGSVRQVALVQDGRRYLVDWPLLYPWGDVGYDYPERIPAYVKKAVESTLRRLGANYGQH